MTEELERSKKKQRGYYGVTTWFMKEMKVIPSQDLIEEDKLWWLKVLYGLPCEKQQILKALDKVILSACLTEDLEQDITEADICWHNRHAKWVSGIWRSQRLKGMIRPNWQILLVRCRYCTWVVRRSHHRQHTWVIWINCPHHQHSMHVRHLQREWNPSYFA